MVLQAVKNRRLAMAQALAMVEVERSIFTDLQIRNNLGLKA
ncbi:MAG: hypothetical protein ACJAUG_000669 [Halioglobus sp.]|jgi:hypothetical protein